MLKADFRFKKNGRHFGWGLTQQATDFPESIMDKSHLLYKVKQAREFVNSEFEYFGTEISSNPDLSATPVKESG
jgi:hypothetical protein